MIKFTNALQAWDNADFETVLKADIEALGVGKLPLQHGMSIGSYALDKHISVMLLNVAEAAGSIQVKAGIFFLGVIPGACCADDPTPVEGQNEYCEVLLAIDKITAEATVSLIEA